MVAERDLGSSLLFFALFLVIIWVATQRVSYLVVGLVLFAAGATFAHAQFSHVQERVDIWLNPWPVANDEGFQIVQSAFAMADGGITGAGPRPRHPHDDPRGRDRLHLRRHRRGAGAARAPPPC